METTWFSPAPVWFDNATGRAPLPRHRRVKRVAQAKHGLMVGSIEIAC
jgi:hypothetical protein